MWHSSHVSVPTAKITDVNQLQQETQLERVVRESKESAEQVRVECQERCRVLEELQQITLIPKGDVDVAGGGDDIGADNDLNHVLMTLNSAKDLQDEEPEVNPDTPRTLEEAKDSADWPRWRASYQEEIDLLQEMGVWELVPHEDVLPGQKIFRGRPVFTIKHDEHEKITRLKTRQVLQRYTMVQGRDYDKTTSSTACAESWHILLHMAATLGWDATQVDVKTAFLNGILPEEEKIFMQQSKGFEEDGKQDWVCHLH